MRSGGEQVELVGGANAAYPLVILGNSWPQVGMSLDKDYPLKISWDLWDVIEAADSR